MCTCDCQRLPVKLVTPAHIGRRLEVVLLSLRVSVEVSSQAPFGGVVEFVGKILCAASLGSGNAVVPNVHHLLQADVACAVTGGAAGRCAARRGVTAAARFLRARCRLGFLVRRLPRLGGADLPLEFEGTLVLGDFFGVATDSRLLRALQLAQLRSLLSFAVLLSSRQAAQFRIKIG